MGTVNTTAGADLAQAIQSLVAQSAADLVIINDALNAAVNPADGSVSGPVVEAAVSAMNQVTASLNSAALLATPPVFAPPTG